MESLADVSGWLRCLGFVYVRNSWIHCLIKLGLAGERDRWCALRRRKESIKLVVRMLSHTLRPCRIKGGQRRTSPHGRRHYRYCVFAVAPAFTKNLGLRTLFFSIISRISV